MFQNRVKNYLTRINEISAKEEESETNKSKLTLDKESSARIIKRSLWANAKKSGGGGGGGGGGGAKTTSQVSEIVNATLENATKRENDDENTSEKKKLKT
jgi:hypothetical protein